MWSRPPKISPILTSDRPVHSRIRYIAMCLAWVNGRERDFETRSPVESWKYVAVLQDQRRRDLVLRLRDQVLQRPLGELDVDRLTGESDQATTRTSAPSSSRTDWSNFEATNSITSGRTAGMFSRSALSCRIAIRVSRSGGCTSTHRPHRNLLTRRSSRLESSCGGRSGRDHDPPCAVQMVERVEELGLGLLALGEELDVVDQEDVDLPVLVTERVALSLADGFDELGDELLRGHVLDPRVRHQAPDVMADRHEEVGLAELRAAVDEQRVVGGRERRLRDAIAAACANRLEGPGTNVSNV